MDAGGPAATRVLVVEDDPSISEPLAEGLRLQGFDPVVADSGAAALEHASGADVVLLDLNLPDLDGLEVCRRIRAGSEVPIIVVSARGEELDRVLGLELGADDYVVKPFSLRELVARVRAVVRRSASRGGPVAGATRFGALDLDPRTRRVAVAGDEVELTPKEFDLLAALLRDPGAVRRREELMEEVWDANWIGSTKTLDVHLAALRHKLGDPGWIETVRGVGYRMVRVR